MNDFRSRYLSCEGRELHFTEWGPREAPPVVMLERFLPKLLKAANDISAMIGGRA